MVMATRSETPLRIRLRATVRRRSWKSLAGFFVFATTRIEELHYITPILNVSSIRQRGILFHRRSGAIPHESVAMPEVQDIRAGKRVPQGRPLHEYVNLYVHARNPMLFKKQAQHAALCVLRVDPRVLDVPAVVVTDGNAASKYTRFAAAPEGLRIVDRELTFAE
jgi:hypothetical protein